jgi:hypothetical protein
MEQIDEQYITLENKEGEYWIIVHAIILCNLEGKREQLNVERSGCNN